MERTITGTHISETFWDMGEFIATAIERAGGAITYADKNARFCGADWNDALEIARAGWTEELPAALETAKAAILTATQEHTMEEQFSPVWDVSGAEVDVARFLGGEPECMIDFPLSQVSKVGRVVTLVAGVSVSSGIKPDTIIRRGRVIVALALALSRLGHAVEIWVDVSGECGPKRKYSHYARVLVKSAHDEMDPARALFAIAHPAMLRCLFFALRDGLPAPWGTWLTVKHKRGWSQPKRPASDVNAYPEGTIFTPHIYSARDVPDADEFIKKYLGELGLLAE